MSKITINGTPLTPGQVMTLDVAVRNFYSELTPEYIGLLGATGALYKARLTELMQLCAEPPQVLTPYAEATKLLKHEIKVDQLRRRSGAEIRGTAAAPKKKKRAKRSKDETTKVIDLMEALKASLAPK